MLSKILALVSYSEIREKKKLMYVYMHVCTHVCVYGIFVIFAVCYQLKQLKAIVCKIRTWAGHRTSPIWLKFSM